MTVEAAIKTAFSAWTALAGVVVRPDKVEQEDVAPYIVYQKVTGRRISDLQGDSGLANPVFQVDVYAATRLQAAALREEARKALQASALLSAVLVSEGAGYEEQTRLFRERSDFSMWFAG